MAGYIFQIVLICLYSVQIHSQSVLWADALGGTGNDEGLGIGVDATGNSYVTGYFEGTATFGSVTLTSAGNRDIFVTKLSAAPYDVRIKGPTKAVTAVTNRVKTLRVKVTNTGDEAIEGADLIVTAPEELTLVKSSIFPK